MRKNVLLAVILIFSGILGARAFAQQPNEAILRVGDIFELRIAGVPAGEAGMVNNNYSVNDDGTVNLPHIGKIRAAGMSPTQLQQAIQSAYVNSEIYSSPTITVVAQNSPRFVNIGGEIRSPGRIPHTPDLTLLTTINAAGGFTEYANKKRVRLSRGNQVFIIDIRKIHADPAQDIPMQPGDQIQVERSFF